MSFPTEKDLTDIIHLPISLPHTTIEAGEWLVVSSFDLPSGLPWVYRLTLLDLLIISGSAQVGVYRNFNFNVTPTTQTPVETALVGVVENNVPVRKKRSENTLDLSTAGLYSVVVYATTTTEVVVTGSVILRLAGA
jgi:hypothetical protein